MAEAVAVLKGVRALLPFSYKEVIIESDNAVVVHSICSAEVNKSASMVILRDAVNLYKNLKGLCVQKSM